jgi:hypothetical protein
MNLLVNLHRLFVMVTATCLLLAAAPAAAQVTTATFYGSVTDTTGALIPGVSVTMSQEGTGAVVTRISDERGEFAFTFLSPGSYTVKMELPGFRTHNSTAFTLGAAQNARRTFVLEVGGINDEITVTGEAPLINTVTPDQRESFSSLEVTQLPLANRDFTGALLSSTGSSMSNTNIRMNGMGGAATRITVDGTEATAYSEGSGTVMFGSFNKIGLVGLDAIGELQTTKGIIPAEYAATMAGNINVITKSGTNDWHGSLFYNYTGAALNARHQNASTKPPQVFNQFGASAGGPILRNRAFIFGAYEGYRETGAAVQSGWVPTPRLREAMIAAVPAYKTYTEFMWPLPNQPFNPNASVAQFIGPMPIRHDENHVTLRGDARFSNTSNLIMSYSRSRPNQSTYQLSDPTTRNGKQNRVNVVHTLSSPSWVSETRFGYNFASWVRQDDAINLMDPNNSSEKIPAGRRLPTINGLNLTSPNGTAGRGAGKLWWMGGATYTVEQKFSKVMHGHSIKFGGMYATRGTGREDINTPEFSYASEADLLANRPAAIRINFAQNAFNLYMPEWGLFVQDDWRVNSKLTLNLGIRYDWYGNPVVDPRDPQHPAAIYNFDGILDTQRFVFAPLRPPNDPFDGDYNNFGPRFGFAYNPDGNAKNVLRGGFGVMFAPRNNSAPASAVSQSSVIPSTKQYTAAEAAARGWKYPIFMEDVKDIVIAENKVSAGYLFDPNFVAPYVMNMYLGVQRQLSNRMMFETAFVGNRGVKFTLLRVYNTIDRVTGVRPNEELASESHFYDTSQQTFYASWQSSLRRQFANNLSFNLHHTWGKGLAYTGGNAAGWMSGDVSNVAIQDFNNIRAARSPVSGDINHVVSSDWIYQLPVFQAGNAALRQILGGWQVSGIFRAQTGDAVDVTQLSPGGPPSRPDVVDIKNMYLKDWEKTGQYLNPAAFAMVPVGTISRVPIRPGNAGFRVARGPGQWNVDLGLGKSFNMRESVKLDLRMDMFNAFNHTNFGNPNANINTPDFGKITSTRGARTIQIHSRLSF